MLKVFIVLIALAAPAFLPGVAAVVTPIYHVTPVPSIGSIRAEVGNSALSVVLQYLETGTWNPMEGPWSGSTLEVTGNHVVRWQNPQGARVFFTTTEASGKLPYSFVSVSLPPAPVDTLVPLELAGSLAAPIAAQLRMTALPQAQKTIVTGLPIWEFRTNDQESPVAVGLAPGQSPQWYAGATKTTEPIVWSRASALAFAASSFGGIGPEACESVYTNDIVLNDVSSIAYVYTNHDYVANRVLNGCTQAEVIMYNKDDAWSFYSGKNSNVKNATAFNAKLLSPSGFAVMPSNEPSCWDRKLGTGEMTCNHRDASGNLLDYYWWTVRNGMWQGNTAARWAPVSIGQNYTAHLIAWANGNACCKQLDKPVQT